MSNITKTVLALIAVIIISIALFVNKTIKSNGLLSSEQLRELGAIIYPKPKVLPDFNFLDQNGVAFTKSELSGKWTFLFPGFSNCPDICPQTLLILNNFYQKVAVAKKPELQIILLSVDPDRDTVARLNSYIKYFNKDFIAISSTVKATLNFGIAINVVFSILKPEQKVGNYNIDHSANIVILDKSGDYVGFIKPPLTEANLLKIFNALYETFAQKPSSKNAIKLPTSQSELQSITSY